MLHLATVPEHDSRLVPPALLVFAHPDDETIAVGARLGRLRAAFLVHVTDGAPANGIDQHAHGFETLAAYQAARQAARERFSVHRMITAYLDLYWQLAAGKFLEDLCLAA